jgi:RHS repeat-associated protein
MSPEPRISAGATGLYYYRARYLDPKLGRFISEDPIGFAGGVNFYGYVENRPAIGRDPLGLRLIPGHFVSGFVAGMLEGRGIAGSFALGWASWRTDFGGEKGSQLKENQYIHAMTPPGMSAAAARAEWETYRSGRSEEFRLGNALHATEDLHCSRHGFDKTWHGKINPDFILNHSVQEVFPNLPELLRMIEDDRGVIRSYDQRMTFPKTITEEEFWHEVWGN